MLAGEGNCKPIKTASYKKIKSIKENDNTNPTATIKSNMNSIKLDDNHNPIHDYHKNIAPILVDSSRQIPNKFAKTQNRNANNNSIKSQNNQTIKNIESYEDPLNLNLEKPVNRSKERLLQIGVNSIEPEDTVLAQPKNQPEPILSHLNEGNSIGKSSTTSNISKKNHRENDNYAMKRTKLRNGVQATSNKKAKTGIPTQSSPLKKIDMNFIEATIVKGMPYGQNYEQETNRRNPQNIQNCQIPNNQYGQNTNKFDRYPPNAFISSATSSYPPNNPALRFQCPSTGINFTDNEDKIPKWYLNIFLTASLLATLFDYAIYILLSLFYIIVIGIMHQQKVGITLGLITFLFFFIPTISIHIISCSWHVVDSNIKFESVMEKIWTYKARGLIFRIKECLALGRVYSNSRKTYLTEKRKKNREINEIKYAATECLIRELRADVKSKKNGFILAEKDLTTLRLVYSAVNHNLQIVLQLLVVLVIKYDCYFNQFKIREGTHPNYKQTMDYFVIALYVVVMSAMLNMLITFFIYSKMMKEAYKDWILHLDFDKKISSIALALIRVVSTIFFWLSRLTTIIGFGILSLIVLETERQYNIYGCYDYGSNITATTETCYGTGNEAKWCVTSDEKFELNNSIFEHKKYYYSCLIITLHIFFMYIYQNWGNKSIDKGYNNLSGVVLKLLLSIVFMFSYFDLSKKKKRANFFTYMVIILFDNVWISLRWKHMSEVSFCYELQLCCINRNNEQKHMIETDENDNCEHFMVAMFYVTIVLSVFSLLFEIITEFCCDPTRELKNNFAKSQKFKSQPSTSLVNITQNILSNNENVFMPNSIPEEGNSLLQNEQFRSYRNENEIVVTPGLKGPKAMSKFEAQKRTTQPGLHSCSRYDRTEMDTRDRLKSTHSYKETKGTNNIYSLGNKCSNVIQKMVSSKTSTNNII